MPLRPRRTRFRLANIQMRLRQVDLLAAFRPIYSWSTTWFDRILHRITGKDKKTNITNKSPNASTRKGKEADPRKSKGNTKNKEGVILRIFKAEVL